MTTLMSKKQLTLMQTIAVMIVPFAWLFESSAVGPILGYLPQTFPDAAPLSIKLVQTMPFISSVIFSIISGKLATFMDKRKLVLIGLLLYAITGVLPFFASSLELIIVLRFLTGCGAGLIMPLTSAIIVEHFDGRARERLLGLAPAFANVMNVIANFLTAAVLGFGWRYCFLLFILVLVIFLIALATPSSPPVAGADTRAGHGGTKKRLPLLVWGMSFLMLVKWCFFGFSIFNLSLFMMGNLQNVLPVQIAVVMAAPALGEAIIGIFFPEVHRMFKGSTLLLAGLVFGAGFFMCAASTEWMLLSAGTLVLSLGSGVITPYLLNLTAVRVPAEQKDMAYGVLNSCIHLGFFLSPFVMELYNIFIGANDNYRALFQAAGISVIIYGVLCLLLKSKLALKAETR